MKTIFYSSLFSLSGSFLVFLLIAVWTVGESTHDGFAAEGTLTAIVFLIFAFSLPMFLISWLYVILSRAFSRKAPTGPIDIVHAEVVRDRAKTDGGNHKNPSVEPPQVEFKEARQKRAVDVPAKSKPKKMQSKWVKKTKDLVVGLVALAVVWFGGNWIVDSTDATAGRVVPVTMILDREYSENTLTIKRAKATTFKYSYQYEVEGKIFKDSDSVADEIAAHSRIIDGERVLTTNGYYDPESHSSSYLEKPTKAGWITKAIGWVLIGFVGLGMLGVLFEK